MIGVVSLKKICIFLLLAIFMVTSSYATYQEASLITEGKALSNDRVTVRVIERDLNYEKLEIMDKENGRVEILESVKGLSGMTYIVTDSESSKKTFIISNFNEIKIIENDVVIWSEKKQESITQSPGNLFFNKTINMRYSWTPWTGWSTYHYTTTNPIALGVSVVAAYFAAQAGLGGYASAFVSAATFAVTNQISTSYTQKQIRQRYDFFNSIAENNVIVTKFRYNNLTGQMGTPANVYYYTPID